MGFHADTRHLTSEQIQELLDQRLPPEEEAQVREHLSFCTECQTELEGWNLLFSDLGNLTDLDPGPAFTREILQAVPVKPKTGWLGGLSGARSARKIMDAHIPSGSFQDYLEQLIPAQPAARLEAHLSACESCSNELREWQGTMGSFQNVGHFAPEPGFSQRVMAQVQVPTPQPLGQWHSVRGRALALARRLLPQTRHGWAVASGIASTPTITIGALIFLVFSRPLLTAGNVSTYLYWKTSGIFGPLFTSVSDTVRQSAVLSWASSSFEIFSQFPFLVGLGGLVISLLSAGSLWVLYKNLIVSSSDDGYARARV